MKEFDRFIDVMHKLRKECPWDKDQTLRSLRTYLIEEAYECLDAMNESESGDYTSLIEELGDVLLQIAFQSEIISEKLNEPVIQKVVTGITDKLIRRHPPYICRCKSHRRQSSSRKLGRTKKERKRGQRSKSFRQL